MNIRYLAIVTKYDIDAQTSVIKTPLTPGIQLNGAKKVELHDDYITVDDFKILEKTKKIKK